MSETVLVAILSLAGTLIGSLFGILAANRLSNYRIEQLEEYNTATVSFFVNGRHITCPKFVEVNGSLEPGSYEIQEGDAIETRSFYTVSQVAEFMDVKVDLSHQIMLNNREATMDSLVYGNFNKLCINNSRWSNRIDI